MDIAIEIQAYCNLLKFLHQSPQCNLM